MPGEGGSPAVLSVGGRQDRVEVTRAGCLLSFAMGGISGRLRCGLGTASPCIRFITLYRSYNFSKPPFFLCKVGILVLV